MLKQQLKELKLLRKQTSKRANQIFEENKTNKSFLTTVLKARAVFIGSLTLIYGFDPSLQHLAQPSFLPTHTSYVQMWLFTENKGREP